MSILKGTYERQAILYRQKKLKVVYLYIYVTLLTYQTLSHPDMDYGCHHHHHLYLPQYRPSAVVFLK